jgi:hypothetical protein
MTKQGAIYRQLCTALLFLLLAPSLALADGASPILNFFHKGTWLAATAVTMVIILVEAGLLRWRIKQIPFCGALWRSAVINIASSITGSVLLIGFGRDSFFMWDTMSLVLPLFIITVVTEIPLIYCLFKQASVTWKRAYFLGIGINLASYAIVFVLEIGLFFAWLQYAVHLDKTDLAEWSNPGLLNRVRGTIYATESRGAVHSLRVFDPQTGGWTPLTNCPSLDPNTWDIEGRVCAFLRWPSGDGKERSLVIALLPDFTVLHEIGPAPFIDHKFDDTDNWQGITELSLSPDAKHLAVLLRCADAVAYKDRSSYYDLGSKCRLIILDVESGRETARAPRWASDHGLCWLSDLRTVLFSSFDDEKLYATTWDQVKRGTGYGIGYDSAGKFSSGLFAFNLDTGGVARFAGGHSASLAAQKGQILVIDGDNLRLLDSSGHETSRIEVPRLRQNRVLISPDGSLILAEIKRHAPFFPGGVPTLVDIMRPSTRHVLSSDFSYRFDWTEGMKKASNNGMEPTR